MRQAPAATLARFDAANGKQVWRVDTKQPLSGGVGADGDLVVVASEKGAVLAYNLKGKLAWKSQVSSEVLMAPRVGQGLVVVRSGDGRSSRLDAKDGKSQWEYRLTLPPLLLRSDSGVVIQRGMVLAGLAAGKVVALNLTNGSRTVGSRRSRSPKVPTSWSASPTSRRRPVVMRTRPAR